jgi:hypothetical protein
VKAVGGDALLQFSGLLGGQNKYESCTAPILSTLFLLERDIRYVLESE